MSIFRAELWSQAAIWLLILVGIVVSTWGSRFFWQYPLTTFLVPLSVYPRPGISARILWETLTPPYVLERLMAWGGALALRGIGQPAEASGILISLPMGSVQVNWGCNGFNMAFAMAVTGLLFGLFFKLDRTKIVSLVAMGIVLALVFNVPRIMLVTLAAVYWGDKWFQFWHGSWGAQIFVGILFTAYYYLVMAIIDRSFKKVSIE
ncbi:MAG: cyanoexosortase C [Leptolyngbyaceae cyanobacterium SL_7_1]|nr:cyanoexosortase C [Leptolyngbyaceae cyanobacterium SL_7_1]